MVEPGKEILLWRITVSAVFVYVQPPFWFCDHASFSWRIVKKKPFHLCGKAEIGWDQALLEICEADIKSTVGVFFHALAPAKIPEPRP